MRCSNCMHYHPKKKGHLGQCHKWRGGTGEGGYDWSDGEIPMNGVVVETDEGWGAYMGPDFGCVLFESQ